MYIAGCGPPMQQSEFFEGTIEKLKAFLANFKKEGTLAIFSEIME